MAIVKERTSVKEGFRSCTNKGFHMIFPNGWTVSVQFGDGNYCENYDLVFGEGIEKMKEVWENKPDLESIDAEVWCWNDKEHYPKDDPLAHQSVKDVLKILNKISKKKK